MLKLFSTHYPILKIRKTFIQHLLNIEKWIIKLIIPTKKIFWTYQWAKTNMNLIQVMHLSHEWTDIHVGKIKLFIFWIEYCFVGFLIEELNKCAVSRQRSSKTYFRFLFISMRFVCICIIRKSFHMYIVHRIWMMLWYARWNI